MYKYQFGGKRRTLSIGPYPTITLAIARDRRVDARRLLAEGTDPSQHKQRFKKAEKAAATTFRDVAKRVLAGARKKKLAAATVDKKQWLLDEYIYPEIGNRPIGELMPDVRPVSICSAIRPEARSRWMVARRYARRRNNSGPKAITKPPNAATHAVAERCSIGARSRSNAAEMRASADTITARYMN